jgi:glycine cleavage system aminomethyltransferase T
MTLNNGGAILGKEPIFSNGTHLGYVSSANYGYSVGKFIAYGYLPIAHAAPGSQVEIEYFGERLAATVSDEPLFDAKGARMKS